MSLDDVIKRLAKNKVVDGIIVVGSAANNTFNPISDYDIIVVLSDTKIKPYIIFTYIDKRITDIVFSTTNTIQKIFQYNNLTFPANSVDGKLVRWLQTGKIVFDRKGLLKKTQKKFQNKKLTKVADENELYSTWFNINYNLKQNKRMIQSKEPAYLTAVDLRLLYSIFQLFFAYFLFRNIEWRGEKEAIRYLEKNDTEYLNILKECLSETDRNKKVKLYEELTKLTIAPISDIWSGNVTSIVFTSEVKVNSNIVKEGLKFWNSLMQNSAKP
ncbi:nucleotidyltransferase domain-containing protein [candidate division WOR-3 bacterium]|nr:nucleotidyltransferase domain-containing protein [candidate division WOR-3 bacterium]